MNKYFAYLSWLEYGSVCSKSIYIECGSIEGRNRIFRQWIDESLHGSDMDFIMKSIHEEESLSIKSGYLEFHVFILHNHSEVTSFIRKPSDA